MPLLFGAVGIVLIICALNDTLSDLGALVKGDFTGSNNFLIWLAALAIAGAFGYVPKFKPVAYAFFVLIFVAIILSNKNKGTDVFAQFFGGLRNIQQPSSGGGGGGGGGFDLGSLSSAFSSGQSDFSQLSSSFGDMEI